MEHRLDREHYQICLSDKAKLSAELTHDFVVSETCGAVVTFHGTTRNAAKDGKECVRLDYSAYGDMALKQLAKIIEATREKYQLHRVAVHHHLGSVPPLESGVIVSVSSKHRMAAFNGCEEIMNRLKSEVPVWKREIYGDGSGAWIHNCTGCLSASSST